MSTDDSVTLGIDPLDCGCEDRPRVVPRFAVGRFVTHYVKRFHAVGVVLLLGCSGASTYVDVESGSPERFAGAAAHELEEGSGAADELQVEAERREKPEELDEESERSPEPEEQDVAEFEEEFDDEFDDPEEVFDPISGFNRAIYHFNDTFYLWVWEPAAKGYRFIVPEVARVAVDKAYKNLRTPPRFANALLQLKFKKTGLELGRFLVNSTIGLLGLFDAAEYFFDWQAPSPEDFGQTLGYYGVGGGFPIVLPFLGPSNVRDGLGMVPDSFAHPIVYFVPMPVSVSIAAGDYFNNSSLHIGEYESLKKDALDPYTFLRDAYEQNREKKIQE